MNINVQKVTLVIFFSFFIQYLNPVDLSAGDYHNDTSRGAPSDTLACSQCHTMHYSQGGETLIYSDTPGAGTDIMFPKLLRAENILSLCLYCHGSSGPITPIDSAGRIPPRVEDTQGLAAAYTPSAGDFADRAVVNEENRHSINYDVTSFEPPGYTAGVWGDVTGRFSTTFNCLFCHAQHGNANYRNLRYDPGNPTEDDKGPVAANANITYSTEVASPANCSDGSSAPCDVYVANPAGLADNREKYYRKNVTFGVASGAEVNGISVFCGKCHGDFYGLSGDMSTVGGVAAGGVGAGDDSATGQDAGSGPWLRHPVGDVSFSQAADNTSTGNGHIDVDTLIDLSNNVGGTYTLTRFANGGIGSAVPTGYEDAAAFDSAAGQQPFCLSCHYAHGGGNANNPGATGSPGLGNKLVDHSMLVFTDLDGDVNIEPTGTGVGLYDATGSISTTEHYMRNTCNQCHNQ